MKGKKIFPKLVKEDLGMTRPVVPGPLFGLTKKQIEEVTSIITISPNRELTMISFGERGHADVAELIDIFMKI